MRFAVFILALAVRLVAIEWTGAARVEFGDGPDYIDAARSLCVQHAYPERGNLPFFRAPGLPFFIAAVTACEPSRVRAIKYGLAVCDAITVLLIFLLARGNIAAAALAGLHPFFIAAVTDVRSEPLFMMLLVAAIFFLARENATLCGIALALAALTRPTALLCIPLFALAFLCGNGRARPLGHVQRPRAAVATLVAALLTLTPWILRNEIRFHEFIPVTDAGGFNLWRGTHPEMMRTVETTDPQLFARRARAFETQTLPAAAREVEARAHTPKTREREWQRLALDNIRSDPSFARTTLKKLALYWRPWLHPAEHGRKAVAVSLAFNLTLFLLGAIGLWRWPDRRIALAVIAFFVVMWLAHAPYIPTMRLRIPLTDPLLIVFASSVLVIPRKLSRLLLILLPIAALAILGTFLGQLPAARHAIELLQSARDEWWAIPLFVALYALCALILFPVGPLAAAAAVMWGWKLGGTIELFTCTLAALPPYFLGRRGLSRWIEGKLDRKRVPELDSFLHFLLRIVPVVPYVALNYLAGATRVRLRDYVLATFAGSIPSVFLFAYFVHTLAAGAMGFATQAKLIGACVLVAIFAIIAKLAADRLARPS